MTPLLGLINWFLSNADEKTNIDIDTNDRETDTDIEVETEFDTKTDDSAIIDTDKHTSTYTSTRQFTS